MVLKLEHSWSAEEGARLKRSRKAKGWSQWSLARKLGVDQSMISRLEKGRPPSTVVAAAVRLYLDHYGA